MANGKRFYGECDAFVSAIQAVLEGLDEAATLQTEALRETLKRWAEATARDAAVNLDRPSWVLSKSFATKVKEFDGAKGNVVWAMAGFRFQERNNRRDPGFYGQFHEGGYAKPPRTPTAPDHFLREAKRKNRRALDEELARVDEKIREAIMRKVAAVRRNGWTK